MLDNRAYVIPFTDNGTCYQRYVLKAKIGGGFATSQARTLLAQYDLMTLEGITFIITCPGFNMSDKEQYDYLMNKMQMCVYMDNMDDFGAGLDKGILVEPMSKRRLTTNNSIKFTWKPAFAWKSPIDKFRSNWTTSSYVYDLVQKYACRSITWTANEAGSAWWLSPDAASFNFVFQLDDVTPDGAGFGSNFNVQARIKIETRYYIRLAQPTVDFGGLKKMKRITVENHDDCCHAIYEEATPEEAMAPDDEWEDLH